MAGGATVWSGEVQVSPPIDPSLQATSRLAVAPDGTVIVVWRDGPWIKGKLYTFDGDVLRDTFRISPSGGASLPSVVAMNDGSFRVAWTRTLADNSEQIWGASIPADGVLGPSFTDYSISMAGLSHTKPETVRLANGDLLVVWESQQAVGQSSDIRYTIHRPFGNVAIAERTLSPTPGAADVAPKVYAKPDGGAMIAWVSSVFVSGRDTVTINYRELSPEGLPMGTGDSKFELGTFSNFIADFNIERLSNGNYVVTYTENSGTGDNLHGAIFDPQNPGLPTRFTVNGENPNYERDPVIKALANGTFVVVWLDSQVKGGRVGNEIIRAQVFASSGQRIGSEISVADSAGAFDPAVVAHADGRFTISYTKYNSHTIHKKTFDPRVPDGDGIFRWTGGAGNDVYAGTVHHDSLVGGNGDDAISGYQGNDTIDGGSGFDTLKGGQGNDNLYGGVNGGWGDSLDGGIGDDYLHGGNDGTVEFFGDTFIGGAGRDTVSYSGNAAVKVFMDRLQDNEGAAKGDIYYEIEGIDGSSGNDQIEGDANANTFWGDQGNDTLKGHAGDDRLDGYWGNDSLDGGSNNDILIGGEGDDTLVGGSGNDYLEGGKGNDVYHLDSPDDVFKEEIDVLYGNKDTVVTSFHYTLMAGRGIEVLQAEAGTATINLTGSNEENNTIIGNDGQNTLSGLGGRDTLIGNAGNDSLIGGAGEDSLNGGSDNDTLDGGADNDTLIGGSGSDSLVGGTGNDSLIGDDGNDVLAGEAGRDTLTGGAGNDVYYVDTLDTVNADSEGLLDKLFATATGIYTLADGIEIGTVETDVGGVTLNGNTSANTLTGNALANTLDGGQGNDSLFGNDGDDVLIGGAGKDLLEGGAGNDIYYVDADDKVNADTGGSTDLLIATAAGTYTLALGIENGEVAANIFNVTLNGNTSANTLTGNALANTLDGGQEDDTLIGNDGDDVLIGGAGRDTLTGGAGNDVYYADALDMVNTDTGGSGDLLIATATGTYTLAIGIESGEVAANIFNVTLNGNAFANTLTGNALANTLDGGQGNDSLFGNDGDDVLIGGVGKDTLTGGAGNDTYNVDANDTVNADTGGSGDLLIATAAGTYTLADGIENGRAIAAIAFAIRLIGNDLDNELAGYQQGDTLEGGLGNDSLSGAEGEDSLAGGDHNDTLRGGDGNDILDGGAGDDILYAERGTDELTGGAGNDIYYVDSADKVNADTGGSSDLLIATAAGTYTLADGIENGSAAGTVAGIHLVGNEAANKLEGNNEANWLNGAEDEDLLYGYGGDDTLDGGEGGDVLHGGEGSDTYYLDSVDDETYDDGTGVNDVDLVIVTAYGEFTLNVGIENGSLDGSAGSASLTGNDGANKLTGNDDSNVLTGGEGDDVLDGGKGDDVLIGGEGRDTLTGGEGDDTYYVDATDTIKLDTGGSRDLLIATAAGTYRLADGIEHGEVKAGVEGVTLNGNLVANTLTGNNEANRLDGREGDDILDGGKGDDTLIGGEGRDTLTGGEGDDTYYVDATDTIKLDTGGTRDLLIATAAGTYRLAGGIEHGKAENGVDGIHLNGNEGANKLEGNEGANKLNGAEDEDLLYGYGGDDTLDGGEGGDILHGGEGSDTYYLDSVDDETYDDGTGVNDVDLVIVTAYGEFTLASGIENGSLAGSAGNASLNGNDGNNKLTGNDGANVLTGGEGDDTLDGGAGDDVLIGGEGGDTYYVDSVDDEVYDEGSRGHDVAHLTTGSNLGRAEALDMAAFLNSSIEEIYIDGELYRAPTNVSFTGDTIREDSHEGDEVGVLEAHDSVGDTLSFSFVNGQGPGDRIDESGRFIIVNDNGTWRVLVAEGAVFDREERDSYSFRILVTDRHGLTDYKDLTITITDVDEGPHTVLLEGATAVTVDENTTDLGVLSAVDPEGDAVTGYTLSGDYAYMFEVVEEAGAFRLQVRDQYRLDYEALAQDGLAVLSLTVVAHAGGLASAAQTITITIDDVNEAVTGATYAVEELAETAQAGDLVATLTDVTDPDEGDTFTFALVDENGAEISGDWHFAVDQDGNIVVGALGLPNVSEPTEMTVRVRITDGGGHTHIQDVTVWIDPVNEAPTAPVVQGPLGELTENDGTGGMVATVLSEDDGVGGTSFTYQLTDDAGGLFTIDQDGVISFVGGAQDYENNPLLQVENAGTPEERRYFLLRVIATETGPDGLSSGETEIRIYLNNVDEVPHTVQLEGATAVTVAENTTDLGVLSAVDPEGDAITGYDLSGDHAEMFEVVVENGAFRLRVKNGYELDFEVLATLTLTVVAYAGSQPSAAQEITITLTDVIEGNDGDNEIFGTPGKDVLDGGKGNDTIYGLGDDDVLIGGEGDDALYGEAGDDTLDGGAGDDFLNGGEGSDTYIVRGHETIGEDGSEGTDTVVVFTTGAYELDNVIENGILDGSAGSASLIGHDGDNKLTGNEHANVLDGKDGDDTLIGGGGADELFGGEGNDTLNGGFFDAQGKAVGDGEADTLHAGAGNDTYFLMDADDEIDFSSGKDEGTDTVYLVADNFATDGQVDWDAIEAYAEYLRDNGIEEIYIYVDGKEVAYGKDDIYEVYPDSEAIVEDLDPAKGGFDRANIHVASYTLGEDVGVEVLSVVDGLSFDVTINGNSQDNTIYGSLRNDTLRGGDGNDLISDDEEDGKNPGSGDDRLEGEAGEDTLIGGLGNDWLDGGKDNDTLFGEIGDDTLDGGEGDDQLDGGEGSDTYYVRGHETIEDNGTEGTDTVIVFVAGEYRLKDFIENGSVGGNTQGVHLIGNDGNNELTGNDEANILTGGGGEDALYGGKGDDELIGGEGHDVLDGGEGADVLRGGEGSDIYFVDDVNDDVRDDGIFGGTDHVIVMGEGEFTLGAGIETGGLDTSATNAHLAGNDLDNTLWGNNGASTLDGGKGNDTLYGEGGADTLLGGEGNDVLLGGLGNDSLVGGLGNDELYGGLNADELYGGDGDDALNGGSENDRLDGGDGNDQLWGDEGADILIGGVGNDTLWGGEDGDDLQGGEGSDSLDGGDGNDTLDGGKGGGPDTLRGGAGDDVYYLWNAGDVIETDDGGDNDTAWVLSINIGDFDGNGVQDKNDVTAYVEDLWSKGIEKVYVDEELYTGGGTGPENNVYHVHPDSPPIVEDVDPAIGGIDTAIIHVASYTLDDGVGVEILEVADDVNFGVEITGNKYDNTIYGGAHDDTLIGGAGNDLISEDKEGGKDNGNGADRLEGGEGEDTLVGGFGNDWLDGGADNDTLYGGSDDDHLNGGEGSDWLDGGDGNDILDSGDGGPDTLIGGKGDDIYYLRNRGDVVEIDEGGDSDTVYALRQNIGDEGTPATRDQINAYVHDLWAKGIENVWIDSVLYQKDSVPTGVRLSQEFVDELSPTNSFVTDLSVIGGDLTGTYTFNLEDDAGGRFYIDGNFLRVKNGVLLDFEDLGLYNLKISVTLNGVTSQPFDVFLGVINLMTEVVVAGNGDDLIKASSGDDNLNGGGGNDTLYGSYGSDQLAGGDGADVFVFDTWLDEMNVDLLVDFNAAEDKIYLKLSIFEALGQEGTLSEEAFTLGDQATTEAHRIIYDPNMGYLMYDLDGVGGEQAILIAVLDAFSLNHDNFRVI